MLEKNGKHADLWGASKSNQNNLTDHLKNREIGNVGKGGNNKNQKGGNGNNHPKSGQHQGQGQSQHQQQLQLQLQRIKAMQDMKAKMANQKAVKFMPEEDDLSDDDFDEDDDEFDVEDYKDDGELDGAHHHAMSKMKPMMGKGHMPNMMMMGQQHQQQHMNAQAKWGNGGANAGNGSHGGGGGGGWNNGGNGGKKGGVGMSQGFPKMPGFKPIGGGNVGQIGGNMPMGQMGRMGIGGSMPMGKKGYEECDEDDDEFDDEDYEDDDELDGAHHHVMSKMKPMMGKGQMPNMMMGQQHQQQLMNAQAKWGNGGANAGNGNKGSGGGGNIPVQMNGGGKKGGGGGWNNGSNGGKKGGVGMSHGFPNMHGFKPISGGNVGQIGGNMPMGQMGQMGIGGNMPMGKGYEEFDEDDDEFDEDDDEFDNAHHHAMGKMKPMMGKGQMPNMMMMGQQHQQQLMNAQAKWGNGGANAGNGNKGGAGGGYIPVQMNGGKKGGGGGWDNGGNGGKKGGVGMSQGFPNMPGFKPIGGGNVGQIGGNMPMGQMGQMGIGGNMPMGQMGQMGNIPMGMGQIPAVQGHPAGAGGYFGGARPNIVAGNPYYQQQQQKQLAAMMKAQQHANGNERFQPMMYARPPSTVNYMPPYPHPPYPYPPQAVTHTTRKSNCQHLKSSGSKYAGQEASSASPEGSKKAPATGKRENERLVRSRGRNYEIVDTSSSDDDEMPIDESKDKEEDHVVECSSESASSGIGSSTPPKSGPEDLEFARAVVKFALGQDFKTLHESGQFHQFRKAASLLVKNHVFSSEVEATLQQFLQDAPRLRRSLDNAVEDSETAKSGLAEMASLQSSLQAHNPKLQKIKLVEEVASKKKADLVSLVQDKNNQIKGLERQILILRDEITKTDQQLQEIGSAEEGLQKKKMDLFYLIDTPAKRLHQLSSQRTACEAFQEEIECTLLDVECSWEAFQKKLVGQF